MFFIYFLFFYLHFWAKHGAGGVDSLCLEKNMLESVCEQRRFIGKKISLDE
jgi:hypothetical protein